MTLPQTGRRRAGFTLIELLVVIAIIAILISLTTAAVQRVRVLGPQTENAARLSQIADAVGRLKNDLKLDYVPSQPLSGGGFTLKGRYADTDPELAILLRAFPAMNHAGNSAAGENNGYTGPNVVLDSNQTLCLFLTGGVPTNFTGFSNNPKRPFATEGPGAVRKGPWINTNPKWVATAPNGQARLVDVYGTPLAYFASIDARVNNYQTQSFSPGGSAGTVAPYQSGGRFVNEKGFQIISAGRDKVFGAGGTTVPAVGGGEDDQAHFSKALLGAGID